MSAAAARTELFFIELDGAAVGACGYRVDHEVAWLFGTSVLPEARGQSLHRASILARLEQARALGCRWAKLDAAPGSRSHQNALRCGFVLGYVRVALEPR